MGHTYTTAPRLDSTFHHGLLWGAPALGAADALDGVECAEDASQVGAIDHVDDQVDPHAVGLGALRLDMADVAPLLGDLGGDGRQHSRPIVHLDVQPHRLQQLAVALPVHLDTSVFLLQHTGDVAAVGRVGWRPPYPG